MLTTKTTLEKKLRALRIWVHDYIYKPFSNEELLVRISNILYNFEQREQIPAEAVPAEEPELSGYELEWMKKLEEVCRSNAKNRNFTVADLSYEMACSERSLQRRLKTLTGLTPKSYIREIKLQYARKLIEEKKITSINRLSTDIGFERTDYFRRIYLQRFGNEPGIK